jgi:hypothetical protein
LRFEEITKPFRLPDNGVGDTKYCPLDVIRNDIPYLSGLAGMIRASGATMLPKDNPTRKSGNNR